MATSNTAPVPAKSDAPAKSGALHGNLLILGATLFFGVNIPVVKFLNLEWLTSNDITLFRLGGGCILFWLASLLTRGDNRIARADFPRILAGGGLGLFAFIFLFNLSLRYANPIDVSIIMTLPPVFVILINVLFRRARPSLLELGGIILAFAGAVIVIMARHTDMHASDALLGNLLALASALCYAIYLVVLEGPTHRYRPVSLLRWVFLAAFIPAIFLIGAFPHAPLFHAEGQTLTPWLMIAFVVVCPTFLAYLMVNPAIKLIGSVLVSIYQYLVPVIATIASVLMGLATLRLPQILAMAAIIAGMLLTNLAKHRRQKILGQSASIK